MGKVIRDYVLDAKTGWDFRSSRVPGHPEAHTWMGTTADHVSSLPCPWMRSRDWFSLMESELSVVCCFHIICLKENWLPLMSALHWWEHWQLPPWWRWRKTTWKEPGFWNNLMEQSHPSSLNCSLQIVREVRNELLLYVSFCCFGSLWYSKYILLYPNAWNHDFRMIQYIV